MYLLRTSGLASRPVGLRVALLVSIVLATMTWNLFNKALLTKEFTNPVLAGKPGSETGYPDPSVLQEKDKNGNTKAFWLVSAAEPEKKDNYFPIFHSTDLINWEMRRHVLEKKPGDLEKWFWAPEITSAAGKYYVYFSAYVPTQQTKCIAVSEAATPEGPYGPPQIVYCDPKGGAIEPTIVTVSNARYLVWKGDRTSYDPTKTKDNAKDAKVPRFFFSRREPGSDKSKITEADTTQIELPAPTENMGGPSLVQHGDYVYLFYWAGNMPFDPNCDTRLEVARSKSPNIGGPYERNPGGPVLYSSVDEENRPSKPQWHCAGSGTPIEWHEQWFFVHHAATDDARVAPPERQVVISSMKWTADGWPKFNRNGQLATRGQIPVLTPAIQKLAAASKWPLRACLFAACIVVIPLLLQLCLRQAFHLFTEWGSRKMST